MLWYKNNNMFFKLERKDVVKQMEKGIIMLELTVR